MDRSGSIDSQQALSSGNRDEMKVEQCLSRTLLTFCINFKMEAMPYWNTEAYYLVYKNNLHI